MIARIGTVPDLLAESRLDLDPSAAVLLAINDQRGYAFPSLPPTQERTARATEQDGTYQELGTVRKRSVSAQD